MTANEIEELKARHFETMQNILNEKLDVKIEGLNKELTLTAAIVEAIGLLEQGEPTLAINTLKASLKH